MFALLSRMSELWIRRGLHTDNPAAGIDKYPEQTRDRWLSAAELARPARALDAHPNQLAANAIRLQLLTGATADLLSAMKEGADEAKSLVFPGKIPGEPIRALKRLSKAVTEAARLSDCRIHDKVCPTPYCSRSMAARASCGSRSSISVVMSAW